MGNNNSNITNITGGTDDISGNNPNNFNNPNNTNNLNNTNKTNITNIISRYKQELGVIRDNIPNENLQTNINKYITDITNVGKPSFWERLRDSNSLVIGASYTLWDYDRFSQIDPNYIGVSWVAWWKNHDFRHFREYINIEQEIEFREDFGIHKGTNYVPNETARHNPLDNNWDNIPYWDNLEELSNKHGKKWDSIYIDVDTLWHLFGKNESINNKIINTLYNILKDDFN
jgi:hypothetical protein